MKNLFTNIVLLIALSVAFSNLTACTKNASPQKGPVIAIAPDNSNTNSNTGSTANLTEAKNSDYPPVPSGILQNEIKDLDGNTFKLEDKKGKVVLVNLWAIWCGPCVAEMPELAAMQEKYRDKGFEVIGLNMGDQDLVAEPAEKIKAFGEKQKLNYQIAYGDGKILTEFNKITRLSGIPQTMLINREGKMTFIVGGGGPRVIENMKAAVEKAMSE